MRHSHYIWASFLSFGLISPVFANESTVNPEASASANVETTSDETLQTTQHPRLEALKELKNIKAKDLKVDANATQPDDQKDPLQPLNRQIFALNDVLDRNVARPLAVQYKQKVPGEVRGSYRQFRKNLGEPWNVVNQLIQGRPLRAAESLGRFTINTITTLGFADPARRLGLSAEEENFGTTLGYYGIPSGPYLVLPVFGPSTFRDAIGLAVDGQARPQKYLFEDHDGLYWSEQVLRGIDARSQLLDIEDVLQGDKYAAIRDIYLQRKNFAIAEKKGLEPETLFIEDDVETPEDEDQPEAPEQSPDETPVDESDSTTK
ncbi:MlaA family lipoprotein [Acinetobacter bouvetii]|uniref:Putative phospholipid-binding lipoprotein MlaA n=1 Tax=Acinetobacter bouvetii TaxID=202951 RepID=A0A811G8T6_9GAMM|nr:VacJ family lipoprotein [Acinetobacter bouvetii]CAB1209698.1 putative phospholipid-binding lipoprotein MlaA [Acinetobacter bouvetii]